MILLIIFLYIICNRYIEKFSVGCQSNGQGNDNKINISGSLTLSTYCKDKNDSCINDSECKSNNCYKSKCSLPKCETSSDCDNGKICWGTGDTRLCDPTMTCENNPNTIFEDDKSFCDNDPTCIWNNESNICEKYNPSWTNFGFYDCNQGKCIQSKFRKGNYKYLKDCEQSCK